MKKKGLWEMERRTRMVGVVNKEDEDFVWKPRNSTEDNPTKSEEFVEITITQKEMLYDPALVPKDLEEIVVQHLRKEEKLILDEISILTRQGAMPEPFMRPLGERVVRRCKHIV